MTRSSTGRCGCRAVRRLPRMAAAVVMVLAVCACAWTADDSEPVGIGNKTDEFRESPCACNEVAPRPIDEDYLKRLQQRLAA